MRSRYAYSKCMNIDERLDALTHSVELLAAIHKDNEREMKRLGKYIRSVSQLVFGSRNTAAQPRRQRRRRRSGLMCKRPAQVLEALTRS